MNRVAKCVIMMMMVMMMMEQGKQSFYSGRKVNLAVNSAGRGQSWGLWEGIVVFAGVSTPRTPSGDNWLTLPCATKHSCKASQLPLD
jgi:hypothetical protein